MKLSVALAVYNEETNLKRCLDSVKSFADEIIIVDGESTDRTVEIAKSYGAKIIQTDNPPIFHINKQKALDACRGDWILQLDADEEVSPYLATEFQSVIQKSGYNGYYISRNNHFWGRVMKKGGQYPDYVIRLVRRGYARFPCKSVHEQIQITGSIGYLDRALDHYSYNTFADYWRKANVYIELTVADLKKGGMKPGILLFADYVIIQPIWKFFTIYFRHKGILDGWQGLVFALFSALHFPLTYRRFIRLAYRP